MPPKGTIRISTEPSQEKLSVWKFADKHYIRTSHALMWPAWSAVVNGAGAFGDNVKCYEVPATSRIMLSVQGHMQSVVLKNPPIKEVRHEQ